MINQTDRFSNAIMGDKIKIVPMTVKEPLTNKTLTMESSSTGMVCLNGINALPEYVVYASDRVDLASTKNRVYLIEHALAFCAIFGIHSAEIQGCCDKWDFRRPTHREAFGAGYVPRDILGMETGQIWGIELMPIEKCQANDSIVEFYTIGREEKYIGANGTKIVLRPPKDLNSLSIICSYDDKRIEISYNAQKGVVDPNDISDILLSRSVGLTQEWNKESLIHAAGDVLSDIVCLGRILANIEIHVKPYYHEATIGIVKRLLALA